MSLEYLPRKDKFGKRAQKYGIMKAKVALMQLNNQGHHDDYVHRDGTGARSSSRK